MLYEVVMNGNDVIMTKKSGEIPMVHYDGVVALLAKSTGVNVEVVERVVTAYMDLLEELGLVDVKYENSNDDE
jgi:hypothetical protein